MREARLISQNNFKGGGRGKFYKEERRYMLELGLGLISGPVLLLINQVLKPTYVETEVCNSCVHIYICNVYVYIYNVMSVVIVLST